MIYDLVFTKNKISQAVCLDSKGTEYRFIDKPHLRLIVYPTKKTFMVRHNFQGQRKVKKIGTFPMMKLPLFELLANEFIEAMESGGNYSLALRATLDQYFYQIYLPDAKKNKRSWADDESRYRLYISPIVGAITLAKIKPYHAQHVLNSLPEHLADRSHDLIRALMSVIFNKAISQELIDKNPCRTTSPKNNCNAVERYMDELEYTAFIKSCLVETDITSDQFSFQSLCLLFALFTGVRIDNCITLNRSMLSSCKTAVYLPTTKPNKPQTIYLSTVAQWVIEKALLASDSEFIFPSTLGQTGHITHPASSFRRICKRAEIACAGSKHKVNPLFPSDNFKIHCLRKTFATVVLNYFSSSESRGLPISSLEISSQLLGHSSTRVTKKHYAFSDDKDLKLAVEVAAQVMIKKIRCFPNLENTTEH